MSITLVGCKCLLRNTMCGTSLNHYPVAAITVIRVMYVEIKSEHDVSVGRDDSTPPSQVIDCTTLLCWRTIILSIF